VASRAESVASQPRPRPLLLATSVAVALAFGAPLAYLLNRALRADDLLGQVGSDEGLRLLGATLRLAVSVAVSATIVGTGLAWLTTRSDVPLRRVWAVLAPLPLVFPSFVGAAALLAAFDRGGMADVLAPGVAEHMPDVEGFAGAWLVLTLFTYPYVYLPVAARLSSLPPSLEESARLLGRRPWAVFRSVVLPQASGAVWAGALLVFLYAVSDFGAVAALRYRTLTVEIYDTRLFNPDKAAAFALLLAVVALAVVAIERGVARRRPAMESVRSRRPLQVPLGRWRWPALGAVAVVIGNALLGPLVVFGYWALRGNPVDSSALGPAALNSAGLGVAAAVLTIVLVLPVAYLTTRHRSRVAGALNAVVVGGFALPGLLVALALAFWVLESSALAALYQTLPVLLAAYAVHFGAQAMRAAQVAVGTVPARLDDAGRMLGAGRWRRLRTIELPLMLPGLVAGGGLVLLSTMKELPATLLLRPLDVDTLAVHIWDAREAARWADTGVASLVLVAMSGVLTWLLVSRRVERFD
jgi:iron(III) transport system permease protein